MVLGYRYGTNGPIPKLDFSYGDPDTGVYYSGKGKWSRRLFPRYHKKITVAIIVDAQKVDVLSRY